MKLKKLTVGMLAAIAAFTVGISVYSAFTAVLSLVPATAAQTHLPEPEVPQIKPVTVEPVSVEPMPADEPAYENIAINDELDDFNRTGEYYLYSDDDTLPKAFADIEYLSIETHEYNEKAGEDGPFWTPLVPKGSIQTKKAFKFDRIAIGTRRLSFQTATVDGISYKFTGSFPDTSDGSDSHSGGPDIKGRLIKIKDNKWAAEMEAKFYVGGC